MSLVRPNLENRVEPPPKRQKQNNSKPKKRYGNRDQYINLEIDDKYLSHNQTKELIHNQIEEEKISSEDVVLKKNSAPSWNVVKHLKYVENSGKSDGARKQLKKYKECKICNKVIKNR